MMNISLNSHTALDWIAQQNRYQPHTIAVQEYESGNSLTFAQIHEQAENAAQHLFRKYHLKAGERIAVIAENCLEYIVLFAIAQRFGCILVPLNYRLSAAEIAQLLAHAAPALVIIERKFHDLIAAAPSFPVLSLQNFAAFCKNPPVHLSHTAHNSDINAPLFLLYTSGTTGKPKGVVYTQKMLFYNSVNTLLALDIGSDSRTVSCLPPFHTGGWNVLLTPFLHKGAFVLLMKKFDAAAMLQIIEKERITILMAVPTMLKAMSDTLHFDTLQAPNLKYIIVGGEALPLSVIEKWHSKKIYLRQGYGMTEVGPNLTSLHHTQAVRKSGSIGKANFYVSYRLVKEDGTDAAIGERGELWFSGAAVFPRYWNDATATAAAFEGEWFKSGDIAIQDAEGDLYIVDRKKNMFISGGENVYPAEVERALLQYAAIAEAVVVGTADAQWGEVGRAFLVLKTPQHTAFDSSDLKQFLIRQLAKFKIPKYFTVLKELPKTDSGKINRAALKTFQE